VVVVVDSMSVVKTVVCVGMLEVELIVTVVETSAGTRVEVVLIVRVFVTVFEKYGTVFVWYNVLVTVLVLWLARKLVPI
jgi:hypothetical protein